MTPAALRRVVSWLPARWRTEVRRLHYARQMATGAFVSPEPEFARLSDFVHAGSWVIDVGANVGHYTKAFSELVGASGRVIAIEPIPETFSLLAANVQRFNHANVSLMNVAASDKAQVVGMTVPRSARGEANFYQAHISEAEGGELAVLAVKLDSFEIPGRVALVKIDAEGHEGHAILGMQRLLRRDRPLLILESGAREAADFLADLGYRSTVLPGSPNIIFLPT